MTIPPPVPRPRSALAVLSLAAALVAGAALASTAVAQPPARTLWSVCREVAAARSGQPRRDPGDTGTLQPGVTLTTIVRGQAGPESFWTVEVAIPSSSPDPDAPATALSDRPTADAAAARLRAAGLDPRVENVPTPKLADAGGGSLGYRVRLGSFATKAEADALRTKVIAAGLGGSSLYTGWDGEPDDVSGSTGPWHVQVLTIDPKKFRGSLDATYGPDIEARETTSTLATLTGATAAVNAGFFVLDPKAGAPGDPAGVAVYDGRLVSEPTAGRPALVIGDNARGTAVERFRWRGEVRGVGRAASAGRTEPSARPDPQLRRYCGRPADLEAPARRHVYRCGRVDRLRLVVRGRDTERSGRRGDRRPARRGHARSGRRRAAARSPRAAGPSRRPATRSLRSWQPPRSASDSRSARHSSTNTVATTSGSRPRTTIVNGGPELVRDGRLNATPTADGMAPVDNPSFVLRLGPQAKPAHDRRRRRPGSYGPDHRRRPQRRQPRPGHRRSSRSRQVLRPPQRHQPGRRRLHHHGRQRHRPQHPLRRHRRTPSRRRPGHHPHALVVDLAEADGHGVGEVLGH